MHFIKDNHLKIIIKTLPSSAGIYQFFDKNENIIYIGKAKNLKKRVYSYFNKNHDSAKLRVLVKQIFDIKYIVVNSEYDALLLENSMIKQHQPKYNILLKDDKTYPWICIKNERFPRVFLTRTITKDGSEYYGPYTSSKTAKNILKTIKEISLIRTCKYDLSEKNIDKKKYKKCLEFHLGNCLAPCQGMQSLEDYESKINNSRHILKGNFGEINSFLKREMMDFADKLEFEKAHDTKQKIQLINKFRTKATVVNSNISNVDVFSVFGDENYAFTNYLKIQNGAIIQSHNAQFIKKIDENEKDLLMRYIVDIREKFDSISREIFLQFEIDLDIPNTKISVPKIGDKRKIVELSIRNAKFMANQRYKKDEILDPDSHTNRIMARMKSDLRLEREPRYIECFDNSNIQGSSPVAACVVFKNGKPSKKDYRHFNIKTVIGPDDYASMEEVVFRRYSRLKNENSPLPQLIVIDGGKGQLSSAVKSLKKLNLEDTIPIISIAKRLEEIFFYKDPIPLYLDKKSETLKIIQQLRDEAHRFGITHHRKKRVKKNLKVDKKLGAKKPQ